MSFIRFYYFGSWSRDGYCGFWRDQRQHSSLYFGFWRINLEWWSCSCALSSYGKLFRNWRRSYLHSQYVASSYEGLVSDVICRLRWRHYDVFKPWLSWRQQTNQSSLLYLVEEHWWESVLVLLEVIFSKLHQTILWSNQCSFFAHAISLIFLPNL